jgi:DNA-binding transcriptional LysR family regulator
VSAGLNFRQIEAFRAVMLTGTTIAAANMLNTTQPSISRSLAQIQAAAKLKLFELDRGRLRPTPEAIMLFEAVQRNFLGLEAIEETVALLRRSGIGRLRVACTPALGMSVMPAIMANLSSISLTFTSPSGPSAPTISVRDCCMGCTIWA